MWSVKKASLDPRVASDPIEVLSRRHRLPRPYTRMLQRAPGCAAEPATNPWRSFGLGGPAESISKLDLALRMHARLQVRCRGQWAAAPVAMCLPTPTRRPLALRMAHVPSALCPTGTIGTTV